MKNEYKSLINKYVRMILILVLIWSMIPIKQMYVFAHENKISMQEEVHKYKIKVQNDNHKGKVKIQSINGNQNSYMLWITPNHGWEIESIKDENNNDINEISSDGEGTYAYKIDNIKKDTTIYISYKKIEQINDLIEVNSSSILYIQDSVAIIKKGDTIQLSSTQPFEIKYVNDIEYTKASYCEDIQKYRFDIITNKEIEILKIFEGKKGVCKEFYLHPKENQNNLKEKLNFYIVKEDIQQPKIIVKGIQNNGYYTKDMDMRIEVIDKESGIEKIEYTIINQNQMEVPYHSLYEYKANQTVIFHIKDIKQHIFIKDHDYDNVKIKIKAIDRAGNVSVETQIIHMNSTKPVFITSIRNKENELLQKDYYTKLDAYYHIEVKDRNFDEKNVILNGKHENFIWIKENEKYYTDVKLNKDGKYSFICDYQNKYYPKGIGKQKNEIIIDTEKPYELDIEYHSTIVSKLLKKLGIYNVPIQVILKAKDDISGIDRFVYSYKNKEEIVSSEDMSYDSKTNTYQYIFKIQPQYKGKVKFTAYDKVGLNTTYEDNEIIVDNLAPRITIQNVEDGKFYNEDKKVMIQVKEENYTEDDVKDNHFKIKITKDTVDTNFQIDPNDVKEGVYCKTVSFHEDGNYIIDINYEDCAGNKANKKVCFTIDQTKPIIHISYDNNNVKNGKYFNKSRTATISIRECNFDTKNVTINLKKDDKQYGNVIWKHYGDMYTTTILFHEDGNYLFEIQCFDFAGNRNEKIDYGNSVATNTFVIDQSAPTNLDIKIDGISVLEQRSNVSFDTFYKAEKDIELEADCKESGEWKLEYQKVVSPKEYHATKKWNIYRKQKGIKLIPNDKYIIYFKATDQAGNETIVHSTGIVVDNKKLSGTIQKAKPQIQLNNRSVDININVKEPRYTKNNNVNNEYYSGICKIFYRIYTLDTKAEERNVIFDKNVKKEGALFDNDLLVYEWNGTIRIDNKKFNSNHIIVEITCIDNAGNTNVITTKDCEIQIDSTAPLVDVEYTNNTVSNNSFFKAQRTAIITITERNFNPKDVFIKITSTNHKLPKQSVWTKVEGTNNLDDTKWKMTISYLDEGDYTFSISYRDLANNSCDKINYHNSVAPNAFTIDKTKPLIHVMYDNNQAYNGNYYNKSRVATITIVEDHFDSKNVHMNLNAYDNGMKKEISSISKWIHKGNQHIATIIFKQDAFYTFDIDVIDQANNQSRKFQTQKFYIDQTKPILEISGVKNDSINKDDVIPVIVFKDTNFDIRKIKITLKNSKHKNIKVEGSYRNISNGIIFTFKNFDRKKIYDDIYTLTARMEDRAGNEIEKMIRFSINRFGSVYKFDKELITLNGKYRIFVDDIKVIETNPTKLKDIQVLLFKNNKTIKLIQNKDFKIIKTGGNGKWYTYTYMIYKENFKEDGIYRIVLRSKDEAGNIAENGFYNKYANIHFGIDRTKPIIHITNLEDNKIYSEEFRKINMLVDDNLMLSSIRVYLDHKELIAWNKEDIRKIKEQQDYFSFTVLNALKKAHNLKVVCMDEAGNRTVKEVKNFYITTDWTVKLIHNKVLIYFGIVVLGVSGYGLVHYVKKKKEDI